MSTFHSVRFSTEEVALLRGKLLALPPVTPLMREPKLAATLVALGVQQEVGTINDELAPYIFDLDSGRAIPRDRLRAEVIIYRGFTGVRIWADGHERLDLRIKGLRELLHPTLSLDADGAVKQCVFFPESIAKIAELHGVELVLVRAWGMNTIFGGFDRSKLFYETNAWELVHNDTVRFSELLQKRQIAFLGTHDLQAHIPGIARQVVDELQVIGAESRERFDRYFGHTKCPPVYALVIPYAAGVLLDDMAQPMNYDAPGRRIVFSALMDLLDERYIEPTQKRLLTRFPDAYVELIDLARSEDIAHVERNAKTLCRKLVDELHRNSVDML